MGGAATYWLSSGQVHVGHTPGTRAALRLSHAFTALLPFLLGWRATGRLHPQVGACWLGPHWFAWVLGSAAQPAFGQPSQKITQEISEIVAGAAATG